MSNDNTNRPRDYFRLLDLNLKELILFYDFQPPCDIICWNHVTDVGLSVCLDCCEHEAAQEKTFSARNLGSAASRHEGLSSGHACVPAVAPGLSYESCFIGALGSERKIIHLSLVPLRATENSHRVEDKPPIFNLFTFLFPKDGLTSTSIAHIYKVKITTKRSEPVKCVLILQLEGKVHSFSQNWCSTPFN